MGWSQNRRPEFMFQINNRHQQLHCKERAVRKGEKTVSYQESLLEVIAVFYNYEIQVICLCCEGFGSSPRHDIPV